MRLILNTSVPTRLATTAALVLLSVAAATFLVGKIEASPSPEPNEPSSHPCAGIPTINVVIRATEFTAGEDIVARANAPSADCSITATAHVSEAQLLVPPTATGATCAINVQTDAGTSGATVLVTGLGECRNLSVSTKISVSPDGAQAALALQAAAATSSGTSTARARTGVYGFAPSGRIQSDVRGTWRHTADSVTLIGRPTYPLVDEVAWLTPGLNNPSTWYGISPPSINAKNVIRWSDGFDELRLKTTVTLSMLAGGGYHCSHKAAPYPSWSSLGANVTVRGECFP